MLPIIDANFRRVMILTNSHLCMFYAIGQAGKLTLMNTNILMGDN